MPLAKIHVLEGHYDQGRIAKLSAAVQAALMNTLRIPSADFYQLIFELPKDRFLHTASFVGMHYTDDLIILDITRVATAVGVSPDDLVITLYEVPGENICFGQGEAQRANAIAPA